MKKLRLLVIISLLFLLVYIILIMLFPRPYSKPINIFRECHNCNVVIIDLDILRTDALPCYGYFRDTAPNICIFAKNGLIFEKNISQSKQTLTSVFSTITSLYPSKHNIFNEGKDVLETDHKTAAEVFKANGYKTYWIGKYGFWTVSPENNGLKGFDRLFEEGKDIDAWKNILERIGNEPGPFFAHFYTDFLEIPYFFESEGDLIESLPRPDGFPLSYKEFREVLSEHLTKHYRRIFTQKALSERPDLFKSPPKTKQQKEDLLKYFLSLPFPSDKVTDRWRTQLEIYVQNEIDNGNPVGEYMHILYDTKVNYLDTKIAELLKYMSSTAVGNTTIVVLMSDRGIEFWEHGNLGHENSLYNELIHVPLIMSIPGLKPRHITSVTQNIDILPTLAELVGISLPFKPDGKSLVEIINNSENKPANGIAVSMANKYLSSIQNQRWKLIWNSTSETDEFELFDLSSDLNERYNVTKQYPEETRKLFEILKKVKLRLYEDPKPQLKH